MEWVLGPAGQPCRLIQVAQSQNIDIKIIYSVQYYLQLQAIFINDLMHILYIP